MLARKSSALLSWGSMTKLGSFKNDRQGCGGATTGEL